MKWNSHEAQRAKQVNKGNSYCNFGGTEIRHIPRWSRIKLGFLLMIGVEIIDIHIDIKNSGVKEAKAWIEGLRKIPGMKKAFRIASEIRKSS